MKIGCDAFNKNILKDTSLQLHEIQNFGDCQQIFDVVITTWKQICSYIKLHQHNLKSTLFVLHQFSDGSHNRHISGTVNNFNKMYNTNNTIVIIGDGWCHFANNIKSPWSRFLWTDRDMLSLQKTYTHWTCLMSRRRPHRDLIEKFLLEHMDLFEQPNHFVYDESTHLNKLQPHMFRKVLSKHNYYKNDPTWVIDKTKHQFTRYNTKSDGDLIFPYHKSKIELVAETVTDYFFITEKTTKPIRAGIPFVMIGSYNFLKKLRRIGFKTFSPFIDESYDDEVDLDTRIQKACTAFKDYVMDDTVDPSELWQVCDHNQKILLKIHAKFNKWESRLAQKIQYQVSQYGKMLYLHTAKYSDGS